MLATIATDVPAAKLPVMDADESPDPFRWPFILRYALAAGATGFALFLASMSEQGWHWAGFALPFALAIGFFGLLGGVVSGMVVSLAAVFAARKSRVEPRRSPWAVAVVCGMSAVSALLCAVSACAFRGVPLGLGEVIIVAAFAAVSVLAWRFSKSSGSESVSMGSL